ncbi:ADP-ribosylglycohydrolase family protein [Demequina sp.]|uniref:ADP-ribosylglycohydrolase family protein n=1 Tax=Demequina sp. TaxID=2050685 RepID=UPI003A87756D
MTKITSSIAHRAAGAIVGSAVGDGIGAPYEFGPARPQLALAGSAADMVGNHLWEPGQWTDDTAMALPILRAAATGMDLADAQAQGAIVSAWRTWAAGAKDVGIQTAAVLRGMRGDDAAAARESARRVHELNGRSGGNGSVMRTAPVGLALMGEEDGVARVAGATSAIAALTHWEDDSRDAAALWSVMIHLAVRDGRVRMADALAALPEARRDRWAGLLEEADGADPDSFAHNGWVIHAVQAAFAAVRAGGIDLEDTQTHTPEAFVRVIEAAVRIHNDTDTVAAIAGGLAGALVGASAIPLGWQRMLHGHPGLGARELTRLAVLAVRGGRPDARGWLVGDRLNYSGWTGRDAIAVHPHDDGVVIGGVSQVVDLPADIDAVVSLCQLGAREVPARIEPYNAVEVWLVDSPDPGANVHLGFVLEQAADTVAEFRAEARRSTSTVSPRNLGRPPWRRCTRHGTWA